MHAMNKRKSEDVTDLVVLKSRKLMESSTVFDDLLNGIDFDDFTEDDFNTIEATVDRPTERSDLLDLTTWRRCIVTDIQYNSKLNALIIQGNEDVPRSSKQLMNHEAKPMVCHLQFVWANSKIGAGDVVSIIGVWNEERNVYCVTLNEGFCVVRPDVLVSGTTVVGGLFCMRKAILSDRFKGIEAAVKMVRLIHTLLYHSFGVALCNHLFR